MRENRAVGALGRAYSMPPPSTQGLSTVQPTAWPAPLLCCPPHRSISRDSTPQPSPWFPPHPPGRGTAPLASPNRGGKPPCSEGLWTCLVKSLLQGVPWQSSDQCCTSTLGSAGSVPDQGTKIPYTMWCKQKNKTIPPVPISHHPARPLLPYSPL